MNTWKPILAALVIFAAGVVTGGLTVNLRQPSAKPRTNPVRRTSPIPHESQLRDLSRRMQKELDLTHEQRERIEIIIHDSQDRMKAFSDQVGPRIRDEFREMRQKVRGELTPEQRKKFENLMKQHDERNKREEPGPHPPPPAEKPE